MSSTVEFQAHFFMVSVLWGSFIVVIYDVLRIIRRIIKHSNFLIALEDILFWVVSSIIIFVMLYEQNDGSIRGFAILGMVLGMILYNLTLSRLLVKYLSMSINFIIKIIINIISFLLKPLKLLIKTLTKFGKIIFKKLKKIGKFVFKGLKKVKKTVKMVISKS